MTLSKNDVNRIAKAVTKGIKDSRSVKKKRWWYNFVWLVPVCILIAAGVIGYFAFTQRPPQNATFRSEFATGATVRVVASPELKHQVQATVSKLEFGAHDTPVIVEIPMALAQRDKLAATLELEYEPDSSLDVICQGLFTLDFTEPTSINVEVINTSEIILNRPTESDENSRVQLIAKNSQPDAGPQVKVTVYPSTLATSFQIERNNEVLGSFELYSGIFEENNMVEIQLSNFPQSKDKGEVINLSFVENEPVFLASLCQSPTNSQATTGSSDQTIDIVDTLGGVLSWGAITQTLAAGERLRLGLDHSQNVKIVDNRIIFDALGDSRINSALRNEVVQLLPNHFSLWDYWKQQLWQWGAISTGTTTFIIILRRLGLWPS